MGAFVTQKGQGTKRFEDKNSVSKYTWLRISFVSIIQEPKQVTIKWPQTKQSSIVNRVYRIHRLRACTVQAKVYGMIGAQFYSKV
jgi:hypothetical protein